MVLKTTTRIQPRSFRNDLVDMFYNANRGIDQRSITVWDIHTIAAHNQPLHVALGHSALGSLNMRLGTSSCTRMPVKTFGVYVFGG